MPQPLVIYHANCLDGFGAAYAAHTFFRQRGEEGCELFPASHGSEAPDGEDRPVYILDFSYRRGVLKALCERAEQVTLIDHHISAKEELVGLEAEHENLTVIFDMHKSGAVLSWEYFHDSPPPPLLQHIQDRDLWRFELPGTEDINAALMAHPFELALWERWAGSPQALEVLSHEGQAINRYRRQMIEAYKKRAVIGQVAGYEVPIVNCPPAIISELLGELAEEHPFAAGYQDKGSKRSWSLRSRGKGGVDVAKIAALFGGGGHRNAAGFGTRLDPSVLFVEPEG